MRVVDGRYEMDFEDLEVKLRDESPTLILLCNPHNPVARVWTSDELKRVISLADQYGVTVVSDEIHSDITYQGHQFISIATLAENSRHISLVGSPSKTFGMQSISNGYIVIPDNDIRKRVSATVDSMYLNRGNAFTTFATIAAYEKGDQWLDQFLTFLQGNVTWIEKFVSDELPGVHMFPAEGTYQVWFDFSRIYDDGEQLKKTIVEKAKLGLTPGGWFDDDNALFMRMNIASPLSKIQAAFYALKTACIR